MNSLQESSLDIRAYHGDELLKWVNIIAEMRISEFRNFPYLYAGNIEIEKKYLTSYTQDIKSAVIIASYQDKIAGILTGMPLTSHLDPVNGAKELFIKNGLNPLEYYYCGEFIVKPEFRNQGIAKMLYIKQVEYAKKQRFKKFCLMTVDRSKKPPSYFDTELLWKKLGFIKTDMKVKLSWPTINENQSIEDREHVLTFWIND